MTTSEQLFTEAASIIPGGVDSPVRAFGSVGGAPRFIASASGSHVTDVEGRSYLDLVGSWGPALLGHADPVVVEAVREAAGRGLSFGAPTENETLLAEEVRRRVPAAEKVRFVSTGTEATMTAIRLARGATGRDLIVKFAGHYHGHSDGLLAAAGSGVATGGLPGSAGVPADIAGLTIVLPYNDPVALRECFAERGGEIAAVILEGAPANMGIVPPAPGFNALVRSETRAAGALMILDEVLTGFRVDPSGWWGLEALGGTLETWARGESPDVAAAAYVPDLFTFGKVIGGGMPLAALGGRAEVMDLLAPVGPVYQAGTLSGNPLATAAGLATLRAAGADTYRTIDEVAAIISGVVADALDAEGVPFRLQASGSLFSFMFGAEAAERGVATYAEAQAQETWRYPAFFHAFLDAGAYPPPSIFEAWFTSAAHTIDEAEGLADAARAAARAAAAATPDA